MKKTLVTGINGQDSSYLAEFLIERKTLLWHERLTDNNYDT